MSINFNNHDITTSGNFTANSGNFNSLSVNNTPVSIVGHSHTSSHITNFNSSVSGLVSGIFAPLSGSLNQFATTSSSQLASVISDETGSGSLVFSNSPTLTGIPLVPTALSGTNTNQIASTSFVRTEISNLVNSAPSALDTLNELAVALGNDANFSTTVTNSLANKANLSGSSFTGSISAPSGNFTQSLQVNNTGVSLSGHTHTSSYITNFNSSVSGLLPTIANSGNNRVLTSTGSTVGINAESNLTFDGETLVIGEYTDDIGGKIVLYNGTSSDGLPSITFIDNNGYDTFKIYMDDSNNKSYINTNYDHDLIISGSNNNSITLDAFSGKIDIVSSGVTISSSGTNVPLTITNDGTGNSFVVNDVTGDTTPFVIDSSGNVGIGTTTPTFVNNTYSGLHIHAATATSLKLTNTTTGQTSTDGFELLQDSAGNAYIWNRESTNISIGTSGTSRIIITSAGNVGIGTISPQARLHVSSTNDGVQAIFTGAQTANTQSILFRSAYHTNNGTAGFANIGWIDNASQGGHLTFGTTTSNSGTTGTPTERMRITSAGDIGIGTSSVSSGFKVDIRGRILSYTTASDGLITTQGLQTTSGGTGKAAIQIDVNGKGGFAWQNDASSGTRSLKLIENNGYGASESTLWTVQSGGNTGLGASPSNDYKLVIGGGTRTDSYTTNPSLVAIKDFTNTNTGDNLSSATYSYATTNGNYAVRNVAINTYFKINSGITNSGSSIGIANNNLRNYALTNDIGTLTSLYGIYNQYGHYNTSAVSPVTTTAIGIQHILWRAAGTITNAFDIYCSDASSGATVTNRWGIYVEHTGKNYFGGNTGIGVSPTYRFEVRGSGATSSTVSFYVSNSSGTALLYTRDDGAINTGTASVSPYNNLTSTAANVVVGSDGFLYRSTSSLRYKTNINDATHGLNEVLQLRSVTFKSHNDGDKIFGGLIAEEVDEIGLTEFVQYDNQNRPDAIHYSNMVSLLIKAIQEQQIMINNLKDRLSILEGN